ncbi:hypothetical protein BJY04DRAFT_216048 [Aspergillus karnatakaensis]|uniref:uncharacterized protein n=1 Tax=Aspergillus karnatakaensis TaxID=1810916 RepID=UPI003CCDFADC
MSLQNTDLAAVSTDRALYLYYQQGTEIKEVTSKNGTDWIPTKTPVGDHCKVNGTSITAYFVVHRGGSDFKGKSTNSLREKIKTVDVEEWKEAPVPSEIKTQPTEYSKLGRGVCHDQKKGAHQWVFFEQYVPTPFLSPHVLEDRAWYRTPSDPQSNEWDRFSGERLQVAELRRASDDSWPWTVRKILPQEAQTALQGTSLAAHLTDYKTHLYFQEHSGKVVEYLGGYDEWSKPRDLIKKEDVEVNTPLAACGQATEENPHVFYAGSGTPAKVKHYREGKVKDVVNYWPGTKLSAAVPGDTIYFFYRQSAHPYGIATMEYDGSSWKQGHDVVG